MNDVLHNMPEVTDWEQLTRDLSVLSGMDDAQVRRFARNLLVQCAREDTSRAHRGSGAGSLYSSEIRGLLGGAVVAG